MIISIDAEKKAFDKIQYPHMERTLKLGRPGNFPQSTKRVCDTTTNNIFNNKN